MIKKIFKILILLFVFFIFRIEDSNSLFSSFATSNGNTYATGCWIPPSVPILSYPTNLTYAGAGSAWDLNPYMDWNDSTTSCPLTTAIEYQYETYSDPGLNSLIYQSGWLSNSLIPALGTPEGSYYWRVRARDSWGNTSEFSLPWLLVVDRTAPTISLSVSGSPFKIVEEKVANGNFNSNLDGWTTAGTVNTITNPVTINNASPTTPITISLYDGNMTEIGRTDTYAWTNRLMQSFDSGAKSLSLYYNFISRDYAPYDDPGFYIRLNGQEIFKANANDVNPSLGSRDGKARSTGWQHFTYNLSHITDSKINLVLYSGNVGDLTNRSFVYVDKITTYFVTASSNSKFKISSSDNLGGSGIDSCYYSLGGVTTSVAPEAEFSLPSSGNFDLEYFCVDKAGNSSGTKVVPTIIDNIAPSTITLSSLLTSANSVTLQWDAPGNDDGVPPTGRASKYDFRYSQMADSATDCSGFDFDTATIIDKVPAPETYNTSQTLEVIGLNQNKKYCFAGKSSDEAPNWSLLSAPLFTQTLAGSTINERDIVINELMWMGSSISSTDKWLELRNMTDHTIDLTGIYLTKLVSGVETVMPMNFTGKSIAAHGYFLIGKSNSFSGNDSQLNVAVDIWDIDLALSTTTLQIKLYDSLSNLIDTAWNGTAPKEGLHVTTVGSEKYYSMERTSIPGDGSDPLNWYTCIDTESTSLYFDGGADERGTPGSVNRSENEPFSHMVDFISTSTLSPQLNITLSEDKKKVKFSIENITGYQLMTYELTYKTFNIDRGIVGNDIDISKLLSYEKETDLATCSSGVCTYDENVSGLKINVILKDSEDKETVINKMLE